MSESNDAMMPIWPRMGVLPGTSDRSVVLQIASAAELKPNNAICDMCIEEQCDHHKLHVPA
jgi:hypothetical protein